MKIHLPAVGPALPIHPRTGLTALGLRRNGAPIWPVRGASPDDPGENDDGGGDPPDDDPEVPPGTGDAGKQAIRRMKEERNAARNELRSVREELAKLAPLQNLADALGGQSTGDGKTDLETLTERLAQHENELAAERLARFRVEVAAEKGLTPAQAKRLVGDTREALEADADEILRDFPAAARDQDGKGRKTPKPDPSQGSRNGEPLSGREAGLAEARKRFGSPAATQNTR